MVILKFCLLNKLNIKELKANALGQRKWCFHESPVGTFDKLFSQKVKARQTSQEEFYIHSHYPKKPASV